MRLRVDLRFLYVPAIIFGVFSSWVLSHYLQMSFPAWKYQGIAVSLIGKVVSLDPSERSIEIIANSVFPGGQPTPMRVTYDQKTVWSSTTYVFNDRSVVKQEKTLELPRPLPAGTLVWLLVDPDSTGAFNKVTGITFLRRTDL